MHFLTTFRRTVQPIRLIVSELLVMHRFHRRSRAVVSGEDEAPAGEWPWMRMHVLHRDGYRCRACHREGDEITLHVDAIGSLSLNSSEFVTLCAACHRIVQNLNVIAIEDLLLSQGRFDHCSSLYC
jgi:hypothetical protein